MSLVPNRMEFIERIRSVLIEHWDPIGIGSNPHLRDEYNMYIPEIARILSAPSVSRTAVFDYLKNIEVDRMGILEDSRRVESVSRYLVEIVRLPSGDIA